MTLLRDLPVYAGAMVVEYATSDLTARGVDEAKYEACMQMSPQLRAAAGCGDYLHATGVVVFEPGAASAGFTVSIVDDLCRERFMEYIQVRGILVSFPYVPHIKTACLHRSPSQCQGRRPCRERGSLRRSGLMITTMTVQQSTVRFSVTDCVSQREQTNSLTDVSKPLYCSEVLWVRYFRQCF